ncbi:UNVERIFIED_CONTAM: hypothetical protein Sindi_2699000 [Sesamum indicum]
MPWLIMGDFNCVKSTDEKQLGVAPTWYELKDFVDCCVALGLLDVPTIGCYYTWYSNNESNPHYSHISARATEAELALQDAQNQLESNPRDVVLRNSLGDLRKKAIFLAEAERHFFYQKAKIHHLKEGDRNTKFFHDMVKRNVARNSIGAITRANVTIITAAEDIAQEFVDYYTSLLGTDAHTLPVDDGVFEWGPLLYPEHTVELCRTVTPLEVKDAIFHISDNKAPDPDGYSSCFFKKAWNIVGDQVCKAVLDFFRCGRMLRQLNHTIIALVPKSDHSTYVADYRPISCCNVIYKAITKIISNRLAPALEHLIDRCQVAFVGGRNITDNIFLAQEMVRQYSRKRISPRCTINIDLRKAFDLVSWTFLSRVLHGYGFPPLFISWIMECVCNSSFSVAMNGSLHGFFPGKKGLRQGDPMSPALFLLTGIQNEELDGILARTEFTRGEMPVRYLGIPLAAQRLSVTNYSLLVDQIGNCISKWTSKSLSYAGRLELIRSVIQGVECFWLQVFPLPAAVIEKIHRLCRNSLWNSRRAPVACEEICHPKEEGGLGAVGQQCLPQRCINLGLATKKGDSPLLQQFAKIRNTVVTDFGSPEAAIEQLTRWSTPKGLQTSKAYEYFRPKLARQPWKAAIWKAFIPPKYSFILWLGLRGRLATRDRLGFLQEEDLCSLCINTKESARHLFFERLFSNFVWSRIRHWIGIKRTMSTLQSAVKWLTKQKTGSSVQNKARHLALACTVYTLWRQRNEVIFEGSTPCPEGLISSVKVILYRVLWTFFHTV